MSNYDMGATLERTAPAFIEVPKTIEVQELAGTLIKLAAKDGPLENFFSDLYYDCVWLKKQIDGLKLEGGFFWSVRESGTAISTVREYVESGGPKERIYRISFTG